MLMIRKVVYTGLLHSEIHSWIMILNMKLAPTVFLKLSCSFIKPGTDYILLLFVLK